MERILITGGAGFIGCNAADYFLSHNRKVDIVDNLSRPGTERNLEWLRQKYRGNGRLNFFPVDIRDPYSLKAALNYSKPDAVIHLAAQVAVTTSVADPRTDNEINAVGTLNILEVVRTNLGAKDVPILYSSTNKVYGEIKHAVDEEDSRYKFKDPGLDQNGLAETEPLDFHSPYGCSKGAGDQYVRDFARMYDMPTVVFRQSCIYGPRQFGNLDQGWMMHLTKQAIEGKPITIYGDGKQVRDVLEVSDLVELYDIALSNIHRFKGEEFNVGGGPQNKVSLLEHVSFLEKTLGKSINIEFDEWRPGDQRVYVSDIRKLMGLGWEPSTDVNTGTLRLLDWVRELVRGELRI